MKDFSPEIDGPIILEIPFIMAKKPYAGVSLPNPRYLTRRIVCIGTNMAATQNIY